MKKRFLLLLAPLLMAIQCEEDPYFGTEYGIQNNSSYDLIIIFEEAGEVLIESQSYQYISKNSNSNSFTPHLKLTVLMKLGFTEKMVMEICF